MKRIPGFVPGISLDCVVFGYENRNLQVLLLKYRNTNAWALPGGFLPQESEMDEAAISILQERTGVRNIFLDQYHTFSGLDRDWDRNQLSKSTFEKIKAYWTGEDLSILEAWFDQRFISTAYVAMVDSRKVMPALGYASEACEWIPIQNLPPLILDHEQMIHKALQHLRTQINHLPIGRELLGEKFTMADLQSLYEAILGKSLDRGNFQRKIMKLNILIRHEKLMTGAQNKAPYLYSINDDVYDRLLKEGIGFKLIFTLTLSSM